MTRANPFEDLGDDFAPKVSPAPKPVQKAEIDRLSADSGFHSRPASPARTSVATAAPTAPIARRQRKTGRNQQINVKATAETIQQLYRLADERNVPLGELLSLALDALESSAQK